MAVGLIKIGERKQEQLTLDDVLVEKYVFAETLDTELYNDITSNKNWMTIGRTKYDFMFCRNQVMQWTYVKTVVMQQPFSALPLEERQYAARYYAVGKTERESVFSQQELQEYWSEFIVTANKTRELRWQAAKGYASFQLSIPDSIDLAKSTNALSNEYVTYGIEAFALDGVDGIFDWVESTSGFAGGTGFNGKSYYTETLKNNIMIILRDGIY